MIPERLGDVLARWHRDAAGWQPVAAYPRQSRAFALDAGPDPEHDEHDYLARVAEVIATLPEAQCRALAHLARALTHGISDPEGHGLPRDARERHALMAAACQELGRRLERAGLL